MELNFPQDEPIFPIRTAAELLNISVHTLRMYEREGLIIPYQKETRHRLYSKVDIERIETIRRSIKVDKMSIAGIKRVYSLIPCWKFIDCTIEIRKDCQAYNGNSKPCWSYRHEEGACSTNDCRKCEVYNDYGNCKSVKDLLREIISD